ncbi:zinc ABC transporter substrate-binding protein [Kaustia mangrovi]|uniref:High-affinity zinc uptake system protein ZnuA n=1 Tax=Kaustia mangrovi TaxID=2593653 RepID=A0A7S8C2M7_9HYPH|nr:zinc ABC transporter substrate-binding protein [Kaustia mangrovi]QPC42233.1 zinc ABC transporter substrate-binding protein [Kaustia mangrovi]
MRRLATAALATAALTLSATIALPAAAQAAPKVVASIKPIHSLVSAVMGEEGAPALIVKGAGSPHAYSLKPSEAHAIAQADLVFWVGDGLETFLDKPLESLPEKARIVTLSDVEGLTLYPVREGGAWERHNHDEEAHDHDGHDHEAEAGHDHDHEADHDHEHDHAEAHDEHGHDEHGHDGHGHDEHAHGGTDPHIWLDPVNAALMADAIAGALAKADPDNAETYAANADALKASLASLREKVADELKPVRARPYIVFHDGYQYFERRFGLDAVGSVTISPEQRPGAQRLTEIRAKLAETGAVCVFAEPQFEPSLVRTVVEGTETRTGTLDPLGAAIPEGPQAYGALLEAMAHDLVACLEPSATE